MDYAQAPEAHYALGAQLKPLRDEGVLIVASGNTVHNLRALQRQAPQGSTYEWAQTFDDWVSAQIERGAREQLVHFRALGQSAQMAHPTWDHFLPLLYADDADPVEVFNDSHQLASIAMRSFIWG
jgi:4,5-DOPA dioxygenase extradiol